LPWGTVLPTGTKVTAVDSTADYRWMVLPIRPAGTGDWSEAQLAGLLTPFGTPGRPAMSIARGRAGTGATGTGAAETGAGGPGGAAGIQSAGGAAAGRASSRSRATSKHMPPPWAAQG
jgi:hypothetical protein